MMSTTSLPDCIVSETTVESLEADVITPELLFPPTIVRRQIEAIRRKRACPGIARFLSSERGLIG